MNDWKDSVLLDPNLITLGATVASLTICSMVTAICTQRGNRKTRQFELFFEARTSAYHNFLCACDKISNMDDPAQLHSLYEASSRALLFASTPTQKLIVDYQQSRIEGLRAPKNGIPFCEQLKLSDLHKEIRGELILSMQIDLQSDHLRPHRLCRQNPYEAQLRGLQNDGKQN